MRTFTVGFDLNSASGLELGFDERDAAEHMSYLFRTEHYEMVLKAGDMERVLPRLAWHLEEPRVGQCYPNFYAAQLACEVRARWCCRAPAATSSSAAIRGATTARSSNDDFEHYVDKYYELLAAAGADREIKPRASRPIWDACEHVWTARHLPRRLHAHTPSSSTRPEDYINHSLYFEAKTFLHGLLVVEDKLSMAHGLETRVPFLDNDLVDFAMRVPARSSSAI